MKYKIVAMPQWNPLEQMRYHFFLILYLDRFLIQQKKNSNIFKQMELFIKSKNSDQCRSHHQKRTQRKKIKDILKMFYNHYYQIRFLDVAHCKMELNHYLTRINPNFLVHINQSGKKVLELHSLLHDFEKNLYTIIHPSCKDQITQTFSLEEKEAIEPTAEEKPLGLDDLLAGTQDTHIHLIVETYNSDIQNL